MRGDSKQANQKIPNKNFNRFPPKKNQEEKNIQKIQAKFRGKKRDFSVAQ